MRQLSGQRNLVVFGLMQVVQVFQCHFISNFFPIFLEYFLGGTYSQATLSALLGFSFVWPHLNNVVLARASVTCGTHNVINLLFWLKVGLALAMAAAGPSSTLLLTVFVVSNRVFAEGTCKLCDLVVADLVDEDRVRNRRPHSIAVLIFGTTNLFSKPGQTLAPLVGFWFINGSFFRSLAGGGGSGGSAGARSLLSLGDGGGNGTWIGSNVVGDGDFGGGLSPTGTYADVDPSRMFALLVGVPIVCGAIQILVWTQYRLTGPYLASIKAQLRGGVGGRPKGAQVV